MIHPGTQHEFEMVCSFLLLARFVSPAEGSPARREALATRNRLFTPPAQTKWLLCDRLIIGSELGTGYCV